MTTEVPHWLSDEETVALQHSLNKVEAFVASSVISIRGKWYYMNITFDNMCGPYDSYEGCKSACYMYARTAFQWS